MNVQLILKFCFDRIAALCGLAVLFMPMTLIAIKVKMERPQLPVIFQQQRVGKDGRLFNIYKFRTREERICYSGNTAAIAICYTEFGAWLSKSKLNELPQLWNVLIGDMSLVGPRPDVSGNADALQGDDREILSMRPGITGPATLKYRNEEELLKQHPNPALYNDEVIFPDKVRINRHYLNNYSFLTDLRILLHTLLPSK